MYFNTNVNGTNIDKEFNKEEKFNFDKYKKYIFIGLGCILLILGLIFILIGRKKISYYIDLSGNREITIYEGDAYIEPGYTARDSKGNDLTEKVVVNNMIDISTIGTYEIIYTLNNTEVKRIINVIEKPTGATIMYLKGSTTIYLKVGDTYKEPGYKVIDSVDGNLGDKVTVTGRVDTSKVGTYKLIYSVTNNSGVTTSKQRVIVVMDSNISLTLNNEDYTNKNVNINIYVMDNYFDYLILPNGNKVTSKSYTYEVSDNGEYKFIIYNKLGEKTEKSINVNNIDKVSPTGSCSGTYGNGKSNITIKASDNIGIQKYVIDGVSYVNNNITLDREVSSVSVRIYDKALNFITITCNLVKKEEVSRKRFVVGTWNIGRGNKYGLKYAREYGNKLRENQIDICGIQEARPKNVSKQGNFDTFINEIKENGDFNDYFITDVPAGNAIVSKYKLMSQNEYNLRNCSEERKLQRVVININGVNISFYNTHTATQYACRMKQYADIFEIMDNDENPTILVGDLNDINFNNTLANNFSSSYEIYGHCGFKENDSYVDVIVLNGKEKIKYVNKKYVSTKGELSDHNLVLTTFEVE